MNRRYEFKDTFGKLSSNEISYLYTFFTPEEMYRFGKLGRKFVRALNSDYLWQEKAKNDLLFLPEEHEQFKSWKDYHQFLVGLNKSLLTGKLAKKFGLKTFRGHKKEIDHVTSISMANAPYNIIVSADAEGKVFTWDKEIDEDGDDYFKNTLIVDAQNKIQGMKFYEKHKKLVIWDRKNTFYFYDVDNLHVPNSPMKNYERFTKVNQFKCEIESGSTMTDIEIDFTNMDIYMSAKLIDSSILVTNHKVYCYRITNGQLVCEYDLGHDRRIETLVKSESVQNNYRDFSMITDCNAYVITPLSVIVGCSYDLTKFVMTNLYQNRTAIPNLFGFTKRTGIISFKLHIDLDYILNLFQNERTGEIIISGLFGDKINILIYTENRIGIELKQTLIIGQEVIRPFNIKMAYFDYDKTGVTYLINGKKVVSVDLLAKKVNSPITLQYMNDNTSKQVLNCQFLDRFRIIEAYDNLHLKIYSARTGEFWFYFIGGSMQVTPKSFVKHPNFTGFHLIVPTRYSIIAAMGNLVREYVFQPKFKLQD